MKTTDFMNTVTVESLQKQLRSQHGVSVDIAKYSKAQLEDYSKKLGAKLKEFELKTKFNESLRSDEYQKTLLISKIVESAINQYIDNPLEDADDLGEDIVDVDETFEDPAFQALLGQLDEEDEEEPEGEEPAEPEGEEPAEPKTHTLSPQAMAALRQLVDSPDMLGLARRALQKATDAEQVKGISPQEVEALQGPIQKILMPIIDAGMQGLTRSKPVLKQLGAEESVGEGCMSKKKKIKEGAEEQAELTMAAKDMVDRFTSFLEDVAEMGAEGMLELADSIRDELGQEQSEAFVNVVKPALDSAQEALTATREALNQGVGIITGEQQADDTIGAEPEGDIEEPVDAEVGGEEPMDIGDEFGASEPATGGTEPEGREKRESYEAHKKSIAESNSIYMKFAQ